MRENLGLTGTKEGCELWSCGRCTVLMDGKAVLSCLVLALDARGKDILIVEELAKDLKKRLTDWGVIYYKPRFWKN